MVDSHRYCYHFIFERSIPKQPHGTKGYWLIKHFTKKLPVINGNSLPFLIVYDAGLLSDKESADSCTKEV